MIAFRNSSRFHLIKISPEARADACKYRDPLYTQSTLTVTRERKMYTPTAQLVTYFNNLRNQKITLVAVPPPSGWQHSPDDGRVVTEDMTLRPFRAAVVAVRHVETFISSSSISLVSPGFLYLHASSSSSARLATHGERVSS